GLGSARSNPHRVITSDCRESHRALHGCSGATERPPAERKAANRQHAKSDAPKYAQAQHPHRNGADRNRGDREAAERDEWTDREVSNGQPCTNRAWPIPIRFVSTPSDRKERQ